MSLALSRRSPAPPVWLLLAAAPTCLLIALPLAYVALRAWGVGAAGVADELLRPRTLELLVNTLTLSLSVTVISAILGVACAWVVERCDLPGRRAWRILLALPLATPAFVASFAWASLDVAFQGMGGAILILSLSHYPLVYLPVAAALRSMDPAYEDVARSLGRGPWRAFFGVALPQVWPALGAGALLALTHMLAEFGALALLRVQTFTTAIFASYELQFDSSNAALQSAVLLALSLPAALFEMRLRRGMRFSRSGRGGRRAPRLLALGRLKLLVVVAFAVLVALGSGVPAGMLVYWLAVGRSAARGVVDIWPAVEGSLGLALPGALIVTALALPLVLAATRRRSPLTALLDRLPYVVHGLPGLVVALALTFFAIRYVPALYQTTALLFAAYAVLFLPLAQSALRASVELAPPGLEEVARSLGKGPLMAFATVTLPNILPGVGASLALMTLELVRELTATLLLAPIGVTTLATEVWSRANDGQYAAAAPFAALLVALSALPVYVFTRRSLELHDL
ncbi:iron(III) transport system permease protein [Methylopila capsulata]|uniref:Iron (III)-transporter permease HitB n=1 Tax=Methylopila capsulata TaxID=61654 RepID=A0A9W6IXS2_9HYPH|nr:iron ABC transporter permease [Methylopila capsulata]MBM7853581.1 iron(III) transport system permease protein [Methylopila capsulata]GLK57204.1 iron (III)-transporter permease HitB [Methylopila capsulata]